MLLLHIKSATLIISCNYNDMPSISIPIIFPARTSLMTEADSSIAARQSTPVSNKKRPVIAWASLAFFCMCALLAGLTAWIVWSSHEARLREAQATTENMARTLATQAYMELELADVMLEDVVEHIRHEGNNDATGERLQSHLQQL